MTELKCPECDKLIVVEAKSRILSDFVDWLGSNDYAICTCEETPGYPKEQWIPIRKSYEQLFADYFGIDLKAVEEERRSLLVHWRGCHGETRG